MVNRIPSRLLIHVVLPLALCGFPTKPMVSGTFSRSWCIVPSVLPLALFNHDIGLRMVSCDVMELDPEKSGEREP